MPKTSVIIPARNEPYLSQTVTDLFEKAAGELEVIVCLEAYRPPDWAATSAKYPGRLQTVIHGQPLGMRACINEGAAMAKGDFLMKTDAHCLFAPGFDVALQEQCDERTVVIPRRFRLDPERWQVIEDGRPPVDYEFLAYPDLKGHKWERRAKERADLLLDETMLAQGSCWFMRPSYFQALDLMDEEHYGTFWKEMLEVGCKAWLSGGRLLTNKKTWYAHWHKARRGYTMESEQQQLAQAHCQKWLTDSTGWKKQTKPFSWLIEHFAPPTWEEWKSQCTSPNISSSALITGNSTSKTPSTAATPTA